MRFSLLARPPVSAIWILWLVWCGWKVMAEEKAELLALDLVAASGALEVFLGPESSRQRIELLPVFRRDSETMMQVPIIELCSSSAFAASGTWNVVRWPRQGDVIVVDLESADLLRSSGVVRWSPNAGESTSPVNLLLRKGKDSAARNVSVIEDGVPNDGEYPWNAGATFKAADLEDGTDYSLMIWTASPPRNSTSGYFTIKKSATTTDNGQTGPTFDALSNVTAQTDSEAVQRCLSYLKGQGGVYNTSADGTFRRAAYFQGYFENASTNREVRNTGTGSAELFLQPGEGSDKDSNSSLGSVGLDMISQSGLGMGTMALNVLQYSRRARVSEMNVVSLNLGTAQDPGSVVLGGYDRALIDASQSAVFTKGPEHPDVFEISLQQIAVSPSDGSSPRSLSAVPGTVSLSYDSQGIRLSQPLIDELLPLIGNPTFDGSLGGYVYAAAPKTDYSFVFHLQNGTKTLPITVPASSLLVAQTSDDNPLTPLQEAGRTYLALSPTVDGSATDMFLGRKFLQHVYLIDSPSSIRRYHLNALPSPLPSYKDFVAASPSSITIFNGVLPASSSTLPRVGPMVGGIVGGVMAICVGILLYYFWARRRRRQVDGKFIVENRSASNAHYSYMSFDKETGLRVPVHSRTRQRGHGLSKETSVRTTHTIPIRYSPTPLEKELHMRDCRYSSSPRPPPAVEIQIPPDPRTPAPALLFTNTTTGSPGRRSSLISAMQRRKSEVSTVAREYLSNSSEYGDGAPSPSMAPEPMPKQTATIARVYSADEVTKPAPRAKGHTRTASLGRVLTPNPIEVLSANSSQKRSVSLDLLRKDATPPPMLRMDSSSNHSRGKSSLSTLLHSSSGEEEVYGLRAVSRDGEFMKLMGIEHDHDEEELQPQP